MRFIDKNISFQNKINVDSTHRTAEYIELPNERTTWDSNKDLTTTQPLINSFYHPNSHAHYTWNEYFGTTKKM